MDLHFIGMLDRYEGCMFHTIDTGRFSLSIQASRTHYCTPRETLESAGMYSAFEVAVFEGNDWLNPMEDERFGELHEDLKDHWESGPIGVGGYVPTELVQRLYLFVKNLENSKSTEPHKSREAIK